ncbi:Hydroxyethylthiazole kinase [uncultured archaeon]|nr:Hydroxyethylthiazole kinase [uncultured archaeon]
MDGWIYEDLEKIRGKKPLVHHITNWVTISDCASITRCLGALPVMAHAREEVSEMASQASALVLNIGTLDNGLIESMKIAGKSANRKGIPVVLDAVGVGATSYRTGKANELLKEIRIGIIKGNAGEIGALAGIKSEVIGVESVSVDGEPKKIAFDFARKTGATVVITGKTDFVSDGKRAFAVSNGHEMMGRIVGTGCMAASAIGCFAAVERDYAKAAAAALACLGIAGEIAAKESRSYGSFKTRFFDAACNLDKKTISENARISEV